MVKELSEEMSEKDSSEAPSLAQADKLLAKGSFVAAQAELRKILDRTDGAAGDEVQRRLERCERELRGQQAKEWVKRGRKSEKRGKLDEALAAFQKAQLLAEEPWMAQRIADLRTALTTRTLAAEARSAERVGNLEAASRLYAAAGATEAGEELRLRQARQRLEAGDFPAAAELYASSGRLAERDRYDWGYCCCRIGQLASCLEIWDPITLALPGLAEQREAVRVLLQDKLLADFAAGDPGLELEPVAAYLHRARPSEEIQAILDFFFLRRLEAHWRDQQLLTVLRMLDEEAALVSASIHQHPRLVEVYAKTAFKLVETSADHLPLFNLYYLTALYRKRFSSRTAEERIAPEKVRAELVRLGEEVIQGHRESRDPATQHELRVWQLEKEIVAELSSILPRNRVAVSGAICTPRFAWRFGCGAAVLALLDQNRHRARDLKTLLALGAYFTPYGPSLCASELGTGQAFVPPRAEPRDEFERFAQNKLCFTEGIRAVQARRVPPRRFFQAAQELFAVDREGEASLLALAAREEDPAQVDQYIELLRQLCRRRPGSEAERVLSRLMSRRAAEQFAESEISAKVFRNILQQALELDPLNEGARGGLEDAELDEELADLSKAFGRHKYERCCQLARDTEFEEVEERFWDMLGWAVNQVPQVDPQIRTAELWELKRAALAVDPDHPLVSRLDQLLTAFEPTGSSPRRDRVS